MKIVGLEEHFATEEVLEAWQKVDPRGQDLAIRSSLSGDKAERLLDFGALRLAAMDDAGIDIAVLSLTTPGVQNLDPSTAVELARSANDQLANAIRSRPDRFQGFATLPTPSPQIAAKELERAVRELGLHGAMLHGRTRDRNLSDPEFWPIFEAADALRTPLYLHPQSPQQSVLDIHCQRPDGKPVYARLRDLQAFYRHGTHSQSADRHCPKSNCADRECANCCATYLDFVDCIFCLRHYASSESSSLVQTVRRSYG